MRIVGIVVWVVEEGGLELWMGGFFLCLGCAEEIWVYDVVVTCRDLTLKTLGVWVGRVFN